jgi:diguanylate cyclase (GGDEF)-like protein
MNNVLFIIIWIGTVTVGLVYIFAQKKKYQKLEKKYREHAIIDELTGIYNRRYLLQRYKEEKNRAKRKKQRMQVVFIDMDNLKIINDRWGHAAGDEAIKRTAAALKASARNYDIYGRYGGDEFVCVLPNTSSDEARIVAERILSAIKKIEIKGIKLGASIGVCEYIAGYDPLEEADQAMYKIKKSKMKGGIYIANYEQAC